MAERTARECLGNRLCGNPTATGGKEMICVRLSLRYNSFAVAWGMGQKSRSEDLNDSAVAEKQVR
jgi:hypothetical protein